MVELNDPMSLLGTMACGQVAGRLLEAGTRWLWARGRAALAQWVRRLATSPNPDQGGERGA
ncbi:conserved hypothetical protein [Frankia sp. Hr75.2]|uniref:hypothetical protein n=1 Tax=Parafrankia sp. Ea1.12 TaxID=573499 RepID=UPI000DA5BF27|nr:hypothetical protein [Parafrankia sp. Ea1.12]TCJ31312.1 hypothetical protein E0504_48950 [Parafrankia sp. BMG5.11]CAI7977761.1 conserved hypothetical protein [Frankia sp. Hr75.2]SQD96702.1 conserved hypothetical protein [Parafrankia sp. Ea1.12]